MDQILISFNVESAYIYGILEFYDFKELIFGNQKQWSHWKH